MKTRPLFLLLFAILLFGNQVCQSQNKQTEDPYLWLEEVESEKSLDWVKAQNTRSERAITTDPLFEPLRQKYIEVYDDKDKITLPDVVGDYVYSLWKDDKKESRL